jgi:hypothetical protein
MYHLPQSAVDRAREINKARWEQRKAEAEARIDAHLALERSRSALHAIRVCLRYDLIDFMNRLAAE